MSLIKGMYRILYIGLFCVLFGAVNAQAESDYDADKYEENDNLFSIIPPTPINIGIPSATKKTPEAKEKTEKENITKDIPSAKEEMQETLPPSPTEVVEQEQPADNTPPPFFGETETNPPKDEAKQESWIGKSYDKLVETMAAPGNKENDTPTEDSIEDMMESSRNSKKRANASVFDISGVMLRMTLPQVETALKARKFSKVSVKFEIPNFIKWRNEEKCRNNGVVGYERLNSCVVTLSQKDGHQYPETVKFMRFDTQEEITVKLTSNFSSNKVYRIYYSSLAPAVTGNSAKANYLRSIKVYDFWKKINRKYGNPDNKDEVIWGLGGNKPYLKAASGKLLLEDPMLRELDYTRMSREDQRFMNTDLFNF